jgi:hypothetical protein
MQATTKSTILITFFDALGELASLSFSPQASRYVGPSYLSSDTDISEFCELALHRYDAASWDAHTPPCGMSWALLDYAVKTGFEIPTHMFKV